MVPITLIIMLANLIGIAAIALTKQRYAKFIASFIAATSLVLSIRIIIQLIQSGSSAAAPYYIPALNVSLSFGVTGISAVLLLMSEIIILFTAISGNTERSGFKASAALICLFQIAAVGLFTSMNMLLFFIFWDVGVIAMFLMINVLGASERRRAASINFIIYELFASSMLLLAIILLYSYSPAHSLQMSYLASAAPLLPMNIQLAVFVSLLLAFMTNMAIFPMHLWLPDAYAEASTQGSMLLSGVLTKFGGYGMIILFTLGITSHYYVYLGILGSASAIYAALILIRQIELKRLIAYSAMLEMGIVLVAIAASSSIATAGAVYAMFSQGIAVALAFLAAGSIKAIFDESNLSRLRDILSGSRTATYAFALAAISIIGFPLTSGFIAELLVFLGNIQGFGLYGLIPLIAILIMGGYLYTVISSCFLSRDKPLKAGSPLPFAQRLGLYSLSASLIIFGVLPFIILGLLRL